MGRKVIIVEGMDCSGKDTSIKAIANHFKDENFHTLHYHAIKTRTAQQSRKAHEQLYRDAFWLVSSNQHMNFIFNRSHYGEYVYGYIYRRYDDPEYVFELERHGHNGSPYDKMFNDATLIIFINSDIQALVEREDGDSLSQGQANLISEEFDRFVDVYHKSYLPNNRKMLIDVAGLSIPEVTKRVTTWLEMVYNGSNN